MAKISRLFKSLFKLLLPVFILLIVAVGAASVWLIFKTAEPPKSDYLVPPEKYGKLSARGAQVTDETWTNKDGTQARGWLLKGAEDAPAVILLHRFGTDRSHVLNLGVKLNEASDFTILMPDLRAHGPNPNVRFSTFGGAEADDSAAAIAYLRGLKSASQFPLIGKNIGLYGIEFGSLTALAAAQDDSVKALALDSVPQNSDDLLASAIAQRFPFAPFVTSKIAQTGTYLFYFKGDYRRTAACDDARTLENRKVLLLAGLDAPQFQDSTTRLSRCFPTTTKIESKTDLNPSGYNIINASIEQSEAYDQRVIDFFKQSLVKN